MRSLTQQANRVYMEAIRAGLIARVDFAHWGMGRLISSLFLASWHNITTRGGLCWNGNAVSKMRKMAPGRELYLLRNISYVLRRKHSMILRVPAVMKN